MSFIHLVEVFSSIISGLPNQNTYVALKYNNMLCFYHISMDSQNKYTFIYKVSPPYKPGSLHTVHRAVYLY